MSDSTHNEDQTTMPPTGQPPSLPPGSPVIRVIDDYELLEEIGRGAMGVVYRARQKGLDRIVALKMILHDDHASTGAKLRFQREAKAIASLDHPNIVQIYDIGEEEDKPFFSLEYVTGGSLDKKLTGEVLSPHESASLVEGLARGIHVAHQENVIHRDLKPANVLITEEGIAKITDFGLAKKLNEPQQTATGAIMGTPPYMAPEQAKGDTHITGPGLDVYALGAILYECLTGRPPLLGASNTETLLLVITQPPVRPSKRRQGIPKDLETICLKCLEKESSRRYANAELLADDLKRFLNGEPIKARPVTSFGRLVRWCKRSPAVASLLFVVILLLVIGSAVSTYFAVTASQKTRDEANAQRERERERARARAQQDLADIRQYSSLLVQAQREWDAGNIPVALDILSSCNRELRDVEHTYLRALFTDNQVVLSKQSESDNAIVFSPDDAFIVSGGWDSLIKVWSARTGKVVLTLKGHTDSVNCLAISPDASLLVSGSEDQSIRLWNLKTGKLLDTIRGHSDSVYSVAFNSAGTQILSGSSDQTIKLWDVATRNLLHTFHGHTNTIFSVAFDSTDTRIASGSRDNSIKVWDTKSRKLLRSLRGHRDTVYSVAFSPDGRRIVSGGEEGTIKVWNASTGAEELSLKGHRSSIYSVAFRPDGQRIVSGSWDQTIKIWNAGTGKEEATLKGHTDAVNSVAFSPDGTRIASVSEDQTVRLWNAMQSRRELVLRHHSDSVNSPDNRFIVSGSKDDTIKVQDASNGRLVLELRGHTSPVFSVAVSSRGDYIVSGSGDNTVRVWNAKTGKTLHVIRGHRDSVYSVAISPDESLLASGSGDGTIRLCEVATGRFLRALTSHTASVNSVAFSPDGTHLISGSGDGTVRLWNLKSGRTVRVLSGHESSVFSVAFSRDGTLIISGGRDAAIRAWNATTGKPMPPITGHTRAINQVSINPVGTRIASASEDRTLRIWDVKTGQEVLMLEGPRVLSSVAVAFSHDGAQIVSGSRDGTVKVWGPSTRENNFPLLNDQAVESRLARLRPDPRWHEEEAERASLSSDRTAEAFHLRWLLKHEPRRAETHIRRGYLMLKERRHGEALRHYLYGILQKPGVSLWPVVPEARNRGDRAATDEKWKEAVLAFDLAVRQNAATLTDWQSLLLCMVANGEIQGFQTSAAEMLIAFPEPGYDLIENLTLASGTGPKALSIAEHLVKEDRNDVSLCGLGMACYRTGKYREAEKALLASIQMQPPNRDPDAPLFLAMTLHRQKKWKEARKHMRDVEQWAKSATYPEWRSKLRWQLLLKEARNVLATFPRMTRSE